MTYRLLALSLAFAFVGAALPRSAVAQSATPAPAAPAIAPVVLPTVVTVADPLMQEIDRRIADSASLARMGSREKYLRLQSDNHYLEQVLKDQDKRIEQLERRLAMLKEQREKGREQDVLQKRQNEDDQELSKQLERLGRLMPVVQTGKPEKP